MSGARVVPPPNPFEALDSTRRTWIMRNVKDGREGLEKVRNHVMEVFRKPLTVYCRRLVDPGQEPDDVVHDFLLRRLTRPDFYEKWQKSGRRLRDWIRTALRFHVLGSRRTKNEHPGLEGDAIPARTDGPVLEFERAYAERIIELALRRARDEIGDAGAFKWSAFEKRFHDRMKYPAIGRELGVSAERARQVVRQVSQSVRRHVRTLILMEGIEPWELDMEILSILRRVRGKNLRG